MSSCSSASAEVTKWEDHVTSFNIKGRRSWYERRAWTRIDHRAKIIQLDAGIHPAYDGLAALPFYDEFDLSTVDILLITQ